MRRFYIRRILRIWPLYFLGIVVGVGYALIFHRYADVRGFVWYLLLVGNVYCGLFSPPANPMTSLWTISIEEQFYLIWPWAARQLNRVGLALCAITTIVVANCVLFVIGKRHLDTDFGPWTNTFVQFEMFATGVLLALRCRSRQFSAPATGLTLAALGPVLWFTSCLVFHAKEPPLMGTSVNGLSLAVGYALFAIGCACVLQGFCLVGSSAIPRWLARLGRISFGLYVYHVIGLSLGNAVVIHAAGSVYWAGRFVVALVATIAAALVSYEYIESPFLRLKRKFEYLHSRPI